MEERDIIGQHNEQSMLLPCSSTSAPSLIPSLLPILIVLSILRILQSLSTLSCADILVSSTRNLGDKLYQLCQALSDYDMLVLFCNSLVRMCSLFATAYADLLRDKNTVRLKNWVII